MDEEQKENLPIVVDEKPVRSTRLKGVWVPKQESSVHKAMFVFYKGLGKNRSLPKVAKHFGKSVPFISTLSRAFRWMDRIHQEALSNADPVVALTAPGMDASRTRIANFVDEITSTLSELAELSKKIKTNLDGETPEDVKRGATLLRALYIFGISVSKPKDLRDLISVLKDIQDFKSEVIPPSISKTSITVEKAVILKDLD